ncbi:hypothetical protein ACF0H5_010541 [Mactra antiquata]
MNVYWNTSTTNITMCQLSLFFFILYGVLTLPTSIKGLLLDEQAMKALGNHGDRIADLEKLVQNLTSSYTDLQAEMSRIQAKNAVLEQQVKLSNETCSLTCNTHQTHHVQTTTNDPCIDRTHPVSCEAYAANGVCQSPSRARNAGCLHYCHFC